MRARGLSILLALAALPALATTVPNALFSDHAVLQRNVPVPVWGTASPGEKVTVTYRGASASATADSSGKWRATLPAMKEGPGEDLVVTGDTTVKAGDVAVGDVWICAGQSNMEFAVDKADGFDAIKALGPQPWLREVKIPHFPAQTPQASFAKAPWRICTPGEVGNFSAVAYQFIAHLYSGGKLPVGIINLSYGGTCVEPWMSPEALAAAKSGAAVLARWEADAKAFPALDAKYQTDLATYEAHQKDAAASGAKFTEKPPAKPAGRPGHYTQPSSLYFGMVTPIMGYPVSGLVWYQGESNTLRPAEYQDLLTSFLRDLRAKWNAPALPLFVVQIPRFDERKLPGQSWAQVRLAQSGAVDAVPGSNLAVIVDLGDVRNKHPTDKASVGDRLALLVRQAVFHEKISAQSPKVKGSLASNNGAEIFFETDGQPLVLKAMPGAKKAFELAGADGVFHPATPALKGEHTVTLISPEVPAPVRARYLQYDVPDIVLFTKAGLPARPFDLKIGP